MWQEHAPPPTFVIIFLYYFKCFSNLSVALSTPSRKEGNVLFNDALNTFYLRLYGVRHMVKDHSDSKRGNPLPPHRLLFPINSNGSFRQDNTYHSLCYASRGAVAGSSTPSKSSLPVCITIEYWPIMKLFK